ncbi:deoxynucleotidyltransferase terminal-interacting protein 1 isoform X2 [Nematostella vectensis]|uniref:deoxynucleotidyltransferase terminal-interacting protein 1 isoform X2 n=1 Tax=Nematostella vectensis TaxID=45351 RepID=UPI0020772AE5|nr:deoxynucleotidyltransferase terminal-interacting protein 1 isoform X2 [Nematostella vectensis]
MAEPKAYPIGEYGPQYQDRYQIARDYRNRANKETEDKNETKKDSQACPFNMTARNFPKKRNHIRSSIASYNRTRGSTYGANKALELVRAALQPSLNAEIETVLKSYQEMFKMAAHNVKDNTGETVTEEQINSVIRKSLDEAKLMFRVDPRGQAEKVRYERNERGNSPSIVRKKRPRLDPERERTTPVSKPTESKTIVAHEWDPDSITDDTEFVMGVKANKALGFAATRGKLYYRHPHLFKYSGDSDDKQWLYEHNLLPITGGKAFLMISSEVKNLVETHDDYKDNDNISLDDLKPFKVPSSMREKMKAYMRSKSNISTQV